MQADAGIQHIPSNDFSLYDHVLDTAVMVGAVPARFSELDPTAVETYFAMARGTGTVRPMEMTKWFDTNYHYMVPEFEPGMDFQLNSSKPIREFLEAKALGILTRPVVLGPVSFVLLGKCSERYSNHFDITERLVPIYQRLLAELVAAGAEWIQIDEPFLAMDLQPAERITFVRAYDRLASAALTLKILLATYFAGLRENLRLALSLSVAALHIDLARAPEQLLPALNDIPERIPATAGFIGKFYVVAAGASTARWALIIILVVSSVIGLFYYLRIVAVMYAAPEHESSEMAVRVSSAAGAVLAALTGLLLWFGIDPEPLLRIIRTVRPM